MSVNRREKGAAFTSHLFWQEEAAAEVALLWLSVLQRSVSPSVVPVLLRYLFRAVFDRVFRLTYSYLVFFGCSFGRV